MLTRDLVTRWAGRMDGSLRLTFLCAVVFLNLLLGPTAAMGQAPAPAEEKISLTELESTLHTLEDPEALESLKAQLRALVAAQEAAAPAPAPQPAPLTRKIVRAIIQLEGTMGKLPDAAIGVSRNIGEMFTNLGKKLADPEYRYKMLIVGGKLAVAVAAAVAALVLLGQVLKRLRQHALRLELAWRRNLALTILNAGAEVIPAVAAYVLAAVFVPWTRIPPPFPQGIFTFTDYLILYGILAGILRALLAPGQALRRIFRMEEPMAENISLRGRQLLAFGVFGYLAVDLLEMYAYGSPVVSVASVLYKIGWIIFIAAAVSHRRGTIVDRLRATGEWEGAPRIISRSTTRLYNLVIERLYYILLAYIIFLALVAVLGYQELFMRLVRSFVITVILVVVGYWGQRPIDLLFQRAKRGEERLRAQYPELGTRGGRYMLALHGLTVVVVWALVIGFILEGWGVSAFQALSGDVGGLIFQRVVLIAVVLLLSALFITISACVIERMMHPSPDPATGIVPEISQQRRTLLPLLNKVVTYFTLFVAGLIILDQIGINPGPLLAGAGIVGLAVGFGAQTLVKDVISGFFILFENQIRVGDVVVIGDKGGLVEAMNLRTLVLRDLAGNVHVIPCGSIDKVMNMTKEYSRYVIDLGVSYREDVDEVMEVVKEIFDGMMRDPVYGPDIIEPLEILGVDDFAESQVTIKMRITTKPIKQWSVAREFRRRIKKTFDERGIEIPFPHRTIYMGEPKKTPSPPLHVKIEREIESAFLMPDEDPDRKERREGQT